MGLLNRIDDLMESNQPFPRFMQGFCMALFLCGLFALVGGGLYGMIAALVYIAKEFGSIYVLLASILVICLVGGVIQLASEPRPRGPNREG